jgi:ABC-2 type transport system permease protein/lipopolysaccharide transport system permease protein
LATVAQSIPDRPPPALRYRQYVHLFSSLKTLWSRRELVWALAERDIRARYKQSNFGFGWALITPVATMVVFAVFLNRVAKFDTGGVPYPLFTYVGLLPWGFFAGSVTSGSLSLVSNMVLLKKVACPREVFPLHSIVVAAVDMLIALVVLVALFIGYGFMPKATSIWVPVILLVQVCFTIGLTLVASAATVYIRDLRQTIPMIVQLGLLATPVAYGVEVIPESIRGIYGFINPMAPVIDGYRRAILLGQNPDWSTFLPAAGTAVVVMILGYMLFKKIETGIADVA